MGFYNILIFIELIDRLVRFIPKILFICFYLILSSYFLYCFKQGTDYFISQNIFIRPEITLKYMYVYVKIWYENRYKVGINETAILMTSLAAPYAIYIALIFFLKKIYFYFVIFLKKNFFLKYENNEEDRKEESLDPEELLSQDSNEMDDKKNHGNKNDDVNIDAEEQEIESDKPDKSEEKKTTKHINNNQ